MRSAILALIWVSSFGRLLAQSLSLTPTPASPISTPLSRTTGVTSGAAVGDFDRDGNLDVALVTNGSPSHTQSVVILLGNGDGTFRPGVAYDTGKTSVMVVAADFNKDGNLDLAVSNFWDAAIAILFGNGDGTFKTAKLIPAGGNNPKSLVAADLNNDSVPDLAVTLGNSTQAAVLYSNGDESFQMPVVLDLGKQAAWIGAADLNGDGIPDIITNVSGGFLVFLNNGNRTFHPASNVTLATATGSSALGDFNADGKIDLAVPDEVDGSVTVLLGNGDGTFQSPKQYPMTDAPIAVLAADFDGDGKLDLAVDNKANQPKNLALLHGNGDGTFEPATYFDAGPEPELMAAGDVNNDHKPDLVVANAIVATPSVAAGSILINNTAMATTPAISNVVNGASFLPGVSPSTWITIQGARLSQTTRTWGSADFVNSSLPAKLDNVSASVNGVTAYVFYVSPTQLNVLAPDSLSAGSARIEVTTAQGSSPTFEATAGDVSPAFFTFTKKYPAAVHTSGIYVGPVGLISGAAFAPVRPGETILLFGTGFGATNPPSPAGMLVTHPEPLRNTVKVTIGGKPVQVQFAGLSASGLDQLNLIIPADLPDGDAALVATVGGVSTQAGLSLTVGH